MRVLSKRHPPAEARRSPVAGVTVQYGLSRRGLPAPRQFRRWAEAALEDKGARVTLRIVGAGEGARLNRAYRGKRGATNVLSFPLQDPHAARYVGDVVICAPVAKREARAQGKTPHAHFAHLTAHGVLHLMGYEHETERQARIMERREKTLLRRLGFSDPYLLRD
jgi:probable rRNA maturation factor